MFPDHFETTELKYIHIMIPNMDLHSRRNQMTTTHGILSMAQRPTQKQHMISNAAVSGEYLKHDKEHLDNIGNYGRFKYVFINGIYVSIHTTISVWEYAKATHTQALISGFMTSLVLITLSSLQQTNGG